MLRNRILNLIFVVLVSVMLTACGDKKDTTKVDSKTTESKTTENKTTTTTTNTDTSKTSQTKTTEKKDSTMTENQTAGKEESAKSSDGNFVNMETSMGNIKIKLFTKEAPITTANFKKLINQGYYNGIIFHRVIDGFMLQGGDPTGTGTGGSKETIQDEFGPGLKHSKAGILSMANRGPNTGSSQFFITLAATPWLDGKHAIFGEVVSGMDVVNKIGKVKTGPNDKPVEPVKMIKVTLSDK
ncbi:MAG TPA: peptidylprolyl isomerase [Ignavibacteria bacterium]|nr:peptidylprolyl isomerase [Ignavibacteria bacterium]